MSIYNYFSNGNPVQGAIFGILFAISIIVILYGWGRKRNYRSNGFLADTMCSKY